jgi:DNA-binding response OmpR family regulator
MKILLLEDDLLLSEIIAEHLEYYEHTVTPVYTGLEAEDLVYSEKFDLLLLDVNVPYLTGFEFLKDLRGTGDRTPAIFITSMNSSHDVLKGFEIGADDYLKKPFEMIELKARIDNIKRHFGIDESRIYSISNNISYDKTRHTLYIGRDEIELARKEGEFLSYLLSHRGEVLSIEDLTANVWSYNTSPTPATIRTYIKNLRRLIGESCISTVRGVGYLFN